MEELEKLIDALNSDEFQAVSITDLESGLPIAKNLFGSEIIAKHGTAEDYFEYLNKNGHRKLMIYPRRKNGNSFKAGTGFKVQFSENDNPEPTLNFDLPQKENTVLKKKKKKSKSKGFFGMGAVEIMDLKINASRADGLVHEVNLLKTENQRLKDENSKLKEEELKNKYDATKQSIWVDIAKGVVDKAPGVMGFLMKAANAPVAEVASMGSADVQTKKSNIPEVKAKLIQAIHRANNEMAQVLLVILENINNQPDEPTEENPNPLNFPADLFELLQRHQIIND